MKKIIAIVSLLTSTLTFAEIEKDWERPHKFDLKWGRVTGNCLIPELSSKPLLDNVCIMKFWTKERHYQWCLENTSITHLNIRCSEAKSKKHKEDCALACRPALVKF